MGASGWHYWTTYDDDLTAVLARLKTEVFANGSYYDPLKRTGPPPRTPDELRRRCAEDGTHSILDIEQIADRPGFGIVSALTADELQALFGTDRPTRAQIDDKQYELFSLRRRWQGVYVVAWRGEQPAELLFIGHSGD